MDSESAHMVAASKVPMLKPGITEDREIVHKYLHAIFDKFIEYGCRTTLKVAGALHNSKGIRFNAKVP
ncbi:hypothetical protein Tco_1369405 [Tanacetum coccineum]